MAELQRTGYTSSTPQNYLIDAGAIYQNLTFDDSEGRWDGDLLGATAGGNKVSISNEYRVVEVDGVFTIPVGNDILMKSTATMEINVKEVTAEAIRMAINGKIRDVESGEAPTGYKVVEGKSRVEEGDYLNNLALVGTRAGSDEPIIVLFDHAFCTSGLDTEFKDDDEAVVKMVFETRAGAGEVANRQLPAKVYYPPNR